MDFKEICNYSAGLIGGILTVLVGHPFDTVKTNLQTTNLPLTTNVGLIYKTYGISGFFRGISFPLLSSGVTNSLFFGSYEVFLNRIVPSTTPFQKPPNFILKLSQARSDMQVFTKHRGTYREIFCAGFLAGLVQTFAACPSEVLKIHLQNLGEADKALRTSSDFGAIRYFIRNKGFLSLYSGMGSMLFREAPSCGIYMYTYYLMNDLFDTQNQVLGRESGVTEQFIAGGIAGIFCWWGVLPLDVIKSRIQADDIKNPKYQGMWDCSKHIYREQGFRGFLRGFWPLTIRAFPINGVAFIAYEYFVKACKVHQRAILKEDFPED